VTYELRVRKRVLAPLFVLVVCVVLAMIVHVRSASATTGDVASRDLEAIDSKQVGIRVLFVGNLYAGYDVTTLTLEALSVSPAQKPILAASYIRPNYTFEAAVKDKNLAAFIRAHHWDYVVLQEHSIIPSFASYWREKWSDPFAAGLIREIRAAGARPLLFETWGYREGDQTNYPRDTYTAMQRRLSSGYGQMGRRFGVDVVPVGDAWSAALTADARMAERLWEPSGLSHTTPAAYLTACVFYDFLTHRNAADSPYTPDISAEERALIAQSAENAVQGAPQ
jgi:hypothetical protein